MLKLFVINDKIYIRAANHQNYDVYNKNDDNREGRNIREVK